MDDRGRWHNTTLPASKDLDERTTDLPRYVTHMQVGEHVEIVKADGTRIKAIFWEAKGSKVVLRTLPVQS